MDEILAGQIDGPVAEKAKSARFDERLSLIGLLLNAVTEELKAVCVAERVLSELAAAFKGLWMGNSLEDQVTHRRAALHNGTRAGNLSADTRYIGKSAVSVLETAMGNDEVGALKTAIEIRRSRLKADAAAAGKKLSNMFCFCRNAFGDGQEIQILVTELTISYYGCDAYYAHNSGLLLNDRQKELLDQIDELTMPLNRPQETG